MTDKTVLDEVRGTITSITPMKIIIQPDGEPKGTIIEAFIGRDYSQFSVGQRVVHVIYTWKRPANKDDKAKYRRYAKRCPGEVDEFEYATYDELSYDQKMQSAKTR